MKKYLYKFIPTKEISAYDLARIFSSNLWLNATDDSYECLPADVKRFYKKEEKK